MAKTIRVKSIDDVRRAFATIANGIKRPFGKTRDLFVLFGLQIDRDAKLMFRHQGSYRGRTPWRPFNNGRGVGFYDLTRGSTTRSKTGKWRIRYGTDLKGRPGKQGKKRRARRYSMSSRLLQASGGFRNSFGIQKIRRKRMVYGTNHELASQIMSNPERQVLQYTPSDRVRYGNIILRWWRKGIRF